MDNIGKRIIIEIKSGIVFAGVLKKNLTIDNVDGYLVETDSKSNFCIWSPCIQTEKITVVPIGSVK